MARDKEPKITGQSEDETTPKTELKIEGAAEEAGIRTTPDVEADFIALLKDYGVAEKAAAVITKHIADTGTGNVFEQPRQLLEKLSKFPRQIPPVTRRNILDHWIAQNKIPVPEGYEEEAELPAEELRRRREGKAEAKYSVDSETGAIRVALTTDKTALTWEEAEQLSKTLKKQFGEGRQVSYVYDAEANVVRMAKENERGGTLEEAEKLKKMADKGRVNIPDEEPPIIQDSTTGRWLINPKTKNVLGMAYLAVSELNRAADKGEPIDPEEAFVRSQERAARLKELFGGTKETGLADTLKVLNEYGLLPKKEDQAGSSKIETLEKRIDSLIEEKHKAELDRLADSNKDLSKRLDRVEEEAKTPRTSTAKGAGDLLSEMIAKMPDKSDIKAMTAEITKAIRGEGERIAPRPPGEQERELGEIEGKLKGQAELTKIENWLLFGEK